MMKYSTCFDKEKSFRYRSELYGIAAIWIILLHVSQYTKPVFIETTENSSFLHLVNVFCAFVRKFFSYGNIGVDFFVFLSPFGLRYSIEKHGVFGFYIRRVKRVVIPYLIVAIIFYSIRDLMRSHNIAQFILDISGAEFWLSGNHMFWFFPFIIILYTIYPVLYKLNKKTNSRSSMIFMFLCICLTIIFQKSDFFLYHNCERALSRIPIFILGILFATYYSEEWRSKYLGNKILIKIVPFVIILGFVVVDVDYYQIFHIYTYLRRYILGTVAIAIILLWTNIRYCGLFNDVAVPLGYLGGVSLETYLIHEVIDNYIAYIDGFKYISTFFWYVAVVTITIVLASILKKLSVELCNTIIPTSK